jgi:hypothetical protein
MLVRLSVCSSLVVLVLAAGCSREGATADTSPRAPGAIANPRVVTGGMVCPLESVNGNPVRMSRSFRIGDRASLVGWTRIADARQAVQGQVQLLFRSTAPDGSQDLSWAGRRVARPDVAMDDPRAAVVGYSASGALPADPGKYKVLLRIGDGNTVRECDTGEVFDLHG